MVPHKEGLQQAKEASEIFKRLGDTVKQARCLVDLAWSFHDEQKAIHHLEVALGIASSLNTVDDLFWIHFALAEVFSGEGRFDDTHAHIKHARSHAVGHTYNLAIDYGCLIRPICVE